MKVRTRDTLAVTFVTLSVCGAWALLLRGRAPSGQWPGVDEAVVGRFVEESGHRIRPLFDWVQGDLLLFAFLVAGLLAGFVLGFFARAALSPSGAAK